MYVRTVCTVHTCRGEIVSKPLFNGDPVDSLYELYCGALGVPYHIHGNRSLANFVDNLLSYVMSVLCQSNNVLGGAAP